MGVKRMKKDDQIREIERLRRENTDLRQLSLTKDALFQKDSLLAAIVESSRNAILGLTVKGTIVSWNRVAGRMFGYAANEVFGHHVSMLAPPERSHEFDDLREKLLAGQSIPDLRTIQLRKNGSTFPALISLSPILNSRREIVGVSEIIQDTTALLDMKAALFRTEMKYRSIFENAIEGVFQTTGDGRPLMANPACLRMLGYSSEKEFMTEVSDIAAQLYADPEDRVRFERLMKWYGMVNNFEVRVMRKDKTRIWVSLNARAVKDARGRIVYYEGMAEDITKRKLAEKNLILEKKISDSIIDGLPGIFYLFNDQLNYVRWNRSFERVSGYSGEEISRMKPVDFFRDEGRERVEERIRECFEGNEITVEAELILKDGSPVPYVFTGRKIVLDDKDHLLGVGLDISERKRTELVIAEREEKYRQLFELESDAIYLADNETGRIFEANGAALSLYGYSREELLLRRIVDLSAEPEKTARSIEEKEPAVPLRYHRKKDGTIFAAEIRSTYTVLNGRPCIIAATRDITDRVRTQAELRGSEEAYRNIYDNAMVGIFQSLPEGRYLRVNPALAAIHGFDSPGEMINTVTNIGKQLYVNPQDRERYKKLLETTDRLTGFEAELYRKDGSRVWISMNVQVVRRENGTVACYQGIVEDITERRKAEVALRESEERYRSLFEHSHDAIFLTMSDGSILDANRAACEMLGRPVEDLRNIGRDGVVDTSDPRLQGALEERGRTGMVNSELTMIRASGERFPVDMTSTVFTDSDGRQKTSLIARDISARKAIEEERKATTEKLRKSLAGTIEVISIMLETRDPYTAGHQRRVSKLARSIARAMGLPGDAVDTVRMAANIHDIGKISVPAEILAKPTNLSDVEMEFIRMHPRTGYEILKVADLPAPIAEMVLQHHEKLDGSGYPQGLRNGEILLEAQILAVADVVEAMASHRPYRPAVGIGAALDEIERNKGVLYHPEVASTCLVLFRERGFLFDREEEDEYLLLPPARDHMGV